VEVANTLAYFDTATITTVKRFIVQDLDPITKVLHLDHRNA
jgi:hypothetical protein